MLEFWEPQPGDEVVCVKRIGGANHWAEPGAKAVVGPKSYGDLEWYFKRFDELPVVRGDKTYLDVVWTETDPNLIRGVSNGGWHFKDFRPVLKDDHVETDF